MAGFEFFWSEQGKRAIINLKKSYFRNECAAEDKMIAAAFLKANNSLMYKIARAIGVEQGTAVHSATTLDPVENVMIKPVSDICNLGCTYCYEGKGHGRYATPVMEEHTLRRIVSEAFANSRDSLTFLWHGGEPTLAGLDFFIKALDFQKEFNTKGIAVKNVIQTNGFRLDPKWIKFFKANRFFVGLSLDGTKDINDKQRIDFKGKGSFDSVMSTIAAIRAEEMDFGIITVINQHHKGRAKDIFNLFTQEGITNFDIHPGYGHSFRLDPADYAEFVNELFDLWLDAGDEQINISLFDEVFKVMNSDTPSTCYFAGTCTRIFAIEADGNIVPCTRPFDRQKYTFGNILTETLTGILAGKSHSDFKQRDYSSQDNSAKCPWHAMCHNGCPQHRTTDGKQDIGGANLYCKCQSGVEGGNYDVWEYITAKAEIVLRKYVD